MVEERSMATFLDELLQDPSTMIEYLELLDENRVGVIKKMHEEWLGLLDEYRSSCASQDKNKNTGNHKQKAKDESNDKDQEDKESFKEKDVVDQCNKKK
jgi:hypothetical protein